MTALPPRIAREADDFLIEAVGYAVDEDLKLIDLAVVPSQRFRARSTQYSDRRLNEIKSVAELWQDRGFGEFVWNGRPNFKFNEAAINASNRLVVIRRRKTLKSRFSTINWNAVNAVAAMIAAVAAILAAYFSYLAVAKH